MHVGADSTLGLFSRDIRRLVAFSMVQATRRNETLKARCGLLGLGGRHPAGGRAAQRRSPQAREGSPVGSQVCQRNPRLTAPAAAGGVAADAGDGAPVAELEPKAAHEPPPVAQTPPLVPRRDTHTRRGAPPRRSATSSNRPNRSASRNRMASSSSA